MSLQTSVPGGSKESACNVEDPGLIPRLGRFPGEGNGNPFQYSCLENSMERGACVTTGHGITESGMTKGLTFSPSRLQRVVVLGVQFSNDSRSH